MSFTIQDAVQDWCAMFLDGTPDDELMQKIVGTHSWLRADWMRVLLRETGQPESSFVLHMALMDCRNPLPKADTSKLHERFCREVVAASAHKVDVEGWGEDLGVDAEMLETHREQALEYMEWKPVESTTRPEYCRKYEGDLIGGMTITAASAYRDGTLFLELVYLQDGEIVSGTLASDWGGYIETLTPLRNAAKGAILQEMAATTNELEIASDEELPEVLEHAAGMWMRDTARLGLTADMFADFFTFYDHAESSKGCGSEVLDLMEKASKEHKK